MPTLRDNTTAEILFPQEPTTNTKIDLGQNIREESMGGVASSSGGAPNPSSEYFSRRIPTVMERRSELSSDLESTIESSKAHWTEVDLKPLDQGTPEANLEVFRSLQHEFPGGFFKGCGDDAVVGRKIAEGGQAEIFEMALAGELRTMEFPDPYVLKVFKAGIPLRALQEQWPPSMLREDFVQGYPRVLHGGMLLKDGRFAFWMRRCWGDLRKLIDLRMILNGNQGPPFPEREAIRFMFEIAKGMIILQYSSIIHRDLKAANVLMKLGNMFLDPVLDVHCSCKVADYECSVGVVGKGFWRAPEILVGVKNGTINFQPHLFTEKSDVYSFGMTCYEILTGRIPFEGIPASDYDVVLRGERLHLPSNVKPWIKAMLNKCWDLNPSRRPSFTHLVKLIGDILARLCNIL